MRWVPRTFIFLLSLSLSGWGIEAHLGLLDDVEHEGLAISATVGTDAEVHLLWELVGLEGGAEAKDGVRWRLLPDRRMVKLRLTLRVCDTVTRELRLGRARHVATTALQGTTGS